MSFCCRSITADFECRRVMTGSLDDLRSPLFWRALAAEAFGTLVLVLIGCGSCIGGNEWSTYTPTMLHISIAFGLSVATMAACLGHLSGCHINPAVTMGMLISRRISIARALLYMVAQCLGATVGAGILKGLTPEGVHGNLGLTMLQTGITREQGFGVEFMITFVLLLTVFACGDSKRTDLSGSIPMTIGLSVTLCHTFAIKYTGSSMNPARTFGPAVLTGIWENHWIYWCGPMFGGIVGSLVYDFVLASDASMAKVKHFVLTSVHDDSKNTGRHYELAEVKEQKESLKIIELEASL